MDDYEEPPSSPKPKNPPHRIVIVGGGLGGLQCARALQRAGFESISILESAGDCGSGSSYQGLNLQVPWSEVQLPEFPLVRAGIEPSGRFPTAEEMQQYARRYAEEFHLLRMIKFNSKLVQLSPDSRHRWQVLYTNTRERRHFKIVASFVVVCTGLHSTPHLPNYPGVQDFKGKQLHSRDFTGPLAARGKTVVLVGNGRAPSDMAARVAVAQAAKKVIALNRQLHWPVPERVGCLSMRRILFSRAGSSLVPHPYYTATPLQRAKAAFARPFKKLVWWGVLRSLRAKIRGAGPAEVHDMSLERLENDLHWGGHLSLDHWRRIVGGGKLELVDGRIRLLNPAGIVLDSGRQIPCDLIVYCTGFSSSYKFFDPRVTLKLQAGEDGLYLYRQMIHPDVVNLAFVGTGVTSSNYVLTTALQSEWLARALRHQVVLPSGSQMQEDIRAQRAWRRTCLPPTSNRGGLMMPYTQAYHDQLLTDMGIKPRRKGFNILGECFAPYSAADYCQLFDDHLARADFQWATHAARSIPEEPAPDWALFEASVRAGRQMAEDNEFEAATTAIRQSQSGAKAGGSAAGKKQRQGEEDNEEEWETAGAAHHGATSMTPGMRFSKTGLAMDEATMKKLAALHAARVSLVEDGEEGAHHPGRPAHLSYAQGLGTDDQISRVAAAQFLLPFSDNVPAGGSTAEGVAAGSGVLPAGDGSGGARSLAGDGSSPSGSPFLRMSSTGFAAAKASALKPSPSQLGMAAAAGGEASPGRGSMGRSRSRKAVTWSQSGAPSDGYTGISGGGAGAQLSSQELGSTPGSARGSRAALPVVTEIHVEHAAGSAAATCTSSVAPYRMLAAAAAADTPSSSRNRSGQQQQEGSGTVDPLDAFAAASSSHSNHLYDSPVLAPWGTLASRMGSVTSMMTEEIGSDVFRSFFNEDFDNEEGAGDPSAEYRYADLSLVQGSQPGAAEFAPTGSPQLVGSPLATSPGSASTGRIAAAAAGVNSPLGCASRCGAVPAGAPIRGVSSRTHSHNNSRDVRLRKGSAEPLPHLGSVGRAAASRGPAPVSAPVVSGRLGAGGLVVPEQGSVPMPVAYTSRGSAGPLPTLRHSPSPVRAVATLMGAHTTGHSRLSQATSVVDLARHSMAESGTASGTEEASLLDSKRSMAGRTSAPEIRTASSRGSMGLGEPDESATGPVVLSPRISAHVGGTSPPALQVLRGSHGEAQNPVLKSLDQGLMQAQMDTLSAGHGTADGSSSRSTPGSAAAALQQQQQHQQQIQQMLGGPSMSSIVISPTQSSTGGQDQLRLASSLQSSGIMTASARQQLQRVSGSDASSQAAVAATVTVPAPHRTGPRPVTVPEDSARAPNTTAAEVLRAKPLSGRDDAPGMVRSTSERLLAWEHADEIGAALSQGPKSASGQGLQWPGGTVFGNPAAVPSLDSIPSTSPPVCQAFGKAAVDATGNLTFRRASALTPSVSILDPSISHMSDTSVSMGLGGKRPFHRGSADFDPAATMQCLAMSSNGVNPAESSARGSALQAGMGIGPAAAAAVGGRVGRPSEIMNSQVLEMLASPPPAISALRARKISALHHSASTHLSALSRQQSSAPGTPYGMSTSGIDPASNPAAAGAGGEFVATASYHHLNTMSSMGDMGDVMPGGGIFSPPRSVMTTMVSLQQGPVSHDLSTGVQGNRTGSITSAAGPIAPASFEATTAAGAAEQVFQGILTRGMDILAHTQQEATKARGKSGRAGKAAMLGKDDHGISMLRAITSFTVQEPAGLGPSFTVQRHAGSVTSDVGGRAPLVVLGSPLSGRHFNAGASSSGEQFSGHSQHAPTSGEASGSGHGVMQRLLKSFRKPAGQGSPK